MMLKIMSITALFLMFLSSPSHATPTRLVIRMNEKTPIENLVAAVSNPRSPRYRKFYTAEEIRTLSGPSDEDYAALLQKLKDKHLTLVSETKTRLFVVAESNDSKVHEQLRATLKSGFSNLGVASITLANPNRKMRPLYRIPSAKGPITALSASDIKKAYEFDPIYAAGITGDGQHLAVASYDGYHAEDFASYFSQTRIPAPKIDQVIFNGTPEINDTSAVETEMDVELSGMIAPGAQIHVFSSAINDDPGEVEMFNAILDDGRSKVVNYSWGTCESDTTSDHRKDMDRLYLRAIAQGVNIFVASGDTGIDGCRNGTHSATWPGSQPNIISVGGTTFKLDSANALNESGWKGSGGGISDFYKLPDYQSTFQSPYKRRSFPDVAFNADPKTGQAIWTQYKTGAGHWMTAGGTSMAAPQWSGFMLLLQEARAKNSKKDIGFLNPMLYSMSSESRLNAFHDITQGNNGYDAQVGWDAVTGLGSLHANQLLEYLRDQ
jgi:hypothetical protein